jgi:hypothetical protein
MFKFYYYDDGNDNKKIKINYWVISLPKIDQERNWGRGGIG